MLQFLAGKSAICYVINVQYNVINAICYAIGRLRRECYLPALKIQMGPQSRSGGKSSTYGIGL